MTDEFDDALVLDTYKSIWLQSRKTGNYKRVQKDVYPAQWFDSPMLRKIPFVRGIVRRLARKEQGVDYYKYYSDVAKAGDKGKWAGEFDRVRGQFESLNFPLDGKAILDISGEPGFFGQEAMAVCSCVVVSAFAEEVADAMIEHLGVPSIKYDFQTDDLTALYPADKFDVVFARYGIGFCEDLPGFIAQCRKVLTPGGILYIGFSPASRAVCARWMFDDYTYLRQYTTDNLTAMCAAEGLDLIGQFDEGSYRWDNNLHWVQKLLSRPYLGPIFDGAAPGEFKQYNLVVVYGVG